MTEQSLEVRRPEAYPFSWSELTRSQQAAAETVAELMLDALGQLDDLRKSPRAGSQLLRERRHTQLAFIDGDRGMGKTSLLLYLMNLGRAKQAPHEQEKKPTIQVSRLKEQKARVVWLETLDMEPIGRRSDLFSAILVRLEDQIPIEHSLRAYPYTDDPDLRQDTLRNLQDLQQDATLSWHGVNPGREARIDPNTLADEVHRAELAGMKLNRRLGQALDGLSKILETTSGIENPIFALPIDDFDLAPSRCLELLRLIRTVTSPGLFFVVAGNTRIAERVLYLQTTGDLANVSGGRPTEELWRAHLDPTAAEIAANNVRKLLPPGQRAELKRIGISNVLKLKIGQKTFRDVLSSIRFQRNTARDWQTLSSLADFFCLDDPFLKPNGYRAAEALSGTPRQARDLLIQLKRHQGSQDDWGEALLRTVHQTVRSVCREEWRLDVRHREALADFFDTENGIELDFEGKISLSFRRFFDGEHVFGQNQRRIIFLRPSKIELRLTDEENRFREVGRRDILVPDRLTAGMIWAHDLAITLWGANLRSGSWLFGKPAQPPLVEAQWGQTAGAQGQPKTLTVEWPMPEWWTVRELQRFRAAVSAYRQKAISLEDSLNAWLTALLDTAMDEQPASRSLGTKTAVKRRQALLNRLVDESPKTTARRELRRSTLLSVLLCLAPEAGVSTSLGNEILGEGHRSFGGLLWDVLGKNPDWIEEARAYRLRSVPEVHSQFEVSRDAAALFAALAPKQAEEWCREQLLNSLSSAENIPGTAIKEGVPNARMLSQDLTDLKSACLRGSSEDLLGKILSFERWLENNAFIEDLNRLQLARNPALARSLAKAKAVLQSDGGDHPINNFLNGALIPNLDD